MAEQQQPRDQARIERSRRDKTTCVSHGHVDTYVESGKVCVPADYNGEIPLEAIDDLIVCLTTIRDLGIK